MTLYRLTKFHSEDEIPLIFNQNKDNLHVKYHRSTKSNSERSVLEWTVLDGQEPDENADENDEFHSQQIDSFYEITNCQGIIHIVKCSIGTGVLALPSAIRYAGYVLGTVGLLVVSLINIYSIHLLVEVVEYIRSINPRKVYNLDYEKTVKMCFESATERLKKFVWLHHILLVCLGVAQIGFLSSYHIFVAENSKALFDFYIHNDTYNIPLWAYQLIYFFFLTPLLFFKTLNKLSIICQIANIMMILSLSISLVYCFLDPLPIEKLQPIKLSDASFLFFGIVIFSLESINLINPIENSLRNKKSMGKKFGIVNISFSLILPLFLIVGFSGYWRFGENVSSSIIISIPMEPWYFMLCKPFYILSIFISYSLQGFVMYHIIWRKVESKLDTEKKKNIVDASIRISIGLSTTILSISIPHFDLLISLIGAFTGSAITLIIPSLCNSVMIYSTKARKMWKFKLFGNALVFTIGIIGCCLGTYSSIINITKTMRK